MKVLRGQASFGQILFKHPFKTFSQYCVPQYCVIIATCAARGPLQLPLQRALLPLLAAVLLHAEAGLQERGLQPPAGTGGGRQVQTCHRCLMMFGVESTVLRAAA